MSDTHMYHDPNYRQGEAYEYGDALADCKKFAKQQQVER